MAIVLYVPALTLETVTGLSQTVSILLVGIVCVFYSLIGGIKAVIITDLFQVRRFVVIVTRQRVTRLLYRRPFCFPVVAHVRVHRRGNRRGRASNRRRTGNLEYRRQIRARRFRKVTTTGLSFVCTEVAFKGRVRARQFRPPLIARCIISDSRTSTSVSVSFVNNNNGTLRACRVSVSTSILQSGTAGSAY